MNYMERIASYEPEMIRVLTELVAIKSVEAPPVVREDGGVLPFGQNIHDAMEYVLEMAAKDGFAVRNVDNYCGHLEFGGDDGIMGIVTHVDVVPEGTGWSSDPFTLDIRDGRMYGRGTADDKGPLVAVYFAMKALRDCGFQPSKKVRLIVGLDEETSWAGMNYYMAHVEKPDFGFTPDADFPVIHGEKGNLVFRLEKEYDADCTAEEKACGQTCRSWKDGMVITRIEGGSAPNIVPNFASASVAAADGGKYEILCDLAKSYSQKTGHRIEVAASLEGCSIQAYGTAAHSARPETGFNAVSSLMDFLGRLPVKGAAGELIRFYNKHIGFELDGSSLGCGLEDDISGRLVFNAGQILYDGVTCTLHINIRYPVLTSAEEVYAGMAAVLNEYGFRVEEDRRLKPIYVPADDPFIQTLMDVYQKHTGDYESKPMVKNYSSYAKAAEGIVAFGSAHFNDEPETAHEKDENISLRTLIKTSQMYADVIYRCAK